MNCHVRRLRYTHRKSGAAEREVYVTGVFPTRVGRQRFELRTQAVGGLDARTEDPSEAVIMQWEKSFMRDSGEY
jgi:hypothetical protein